MNLILKEMKEFSNDHVRMFMASLEAWESMNEVIETAEKLSKHIDIVHARSSFSEFSTLCLLNIHLKSCLEHLNVVLTPDEEGEEEAL